MTNRILSFVLKMNMIFCMLLCFAQGTALLAGTSSLLQTLLVIPTSLALTYKMGQIVHRLDRAPRRRKVTLRVAKVEKEPIRVA